MEDKINIALIGMPGVGKSTVGALLAKRLNKVFVDTDELIEQAQQARLQDILDTKGYLRLRELEEQTILASSLHNAVIATGGSVVYGASAIRHLQTKAMFFYLAANIETLQSRIDNWLSRGIACPAGQSIASLFAEREPLYRHYADRTICTDNLTEDAVVEQVLSEFLPSL